MVFYERIDNYFQLISHIVEEIDHNYVHVVCKEVDA